MFRLVPIRPTFAPAAPSSISLMRLVVVVLPLVPVTATRVMPSPGRPNQLAEISARASRVSSAVSQGPGWSGGVRHTTAAAPRSSAA